MLIRNSASQRSMQMASSTHRRDPVQVDSLALLVQLVGFGSGLPVGSEVLQRLGWSWKLRWLERSGGFRNGFWWLLGSYEERSRREWDRAGWDVSYELQWTLLMSEKICVF